MRAVTTLQYKLYIVSQQTPSIKLQTKLTQNKMPLTTTIDIYIIQYCAILNTKYNTLT